MSTRPRYIPLEEREDYGHRERRPVQRLSRVSDMTGQTLPPQRRFATQQLIASQGTARPVAPLSQARPKQAGSVRQARSGGLGRGLMAFGCGLFLMSVLYF